VRIYYTERYYTARTDRSSIKIKKNNLTLLSLAHGGLNDKLKRAPFEWSPLGFPVLHFGLRWDDISRTRAFLALSNLELDLLAFVKSGVTVHLDFGVMNE
jgi:hypothetical protein